MIATTERLKMTFTLDDNCTPMGADVAQAMSNAVITPGKDKRLIKTSLK